MSRRERDTMPPSSVERRKEERFLRDMKERGEWHARINNLARQGVVDGAAAMAPAAAVLGVVGAFVFWWKKKKNPTSFGGDSVETAAKRLGIV